MTKFFVLLPPSAGRFVPLAAGSDKNLKLTSPDDLEVFKAMLKMKK